MSERACSLHILCVSDSRYNIIFHCLCQFFQSIGFVSESRVLVKEGCLKRITAEKSLLSKIVRRTKTLEMFLFNDLIIICKKYDLISYLVHIYLDLIPQYIESFIIYLLFYLDLRTQDIQ